MIQADPAPLAHLTGPALGPLRCENLIHMLERGAQTFDRPTLTILDRKNEARAKTCADLLEGARRSATFLLNRGLSKGDRVVLLLLNDEQFIDAFFGTILAGGVPVAVSPPASFGDLDKYLRNLAHVVTNSGARFMVTFPRIRKVIGSVLAESAQLAELILASEITVERPKKTGYPSIDPGQVAFYQYTSGSTGLPKGAMLTHRALLSNVDAIARGIDCNPKDVSVSWLPMFHDMGLIGSLFTGLYTGAHLVTMLPEAFVMNPVSWLQNITRFRATIATAPNFAYHLLASRVSEEALGDLDLSSLKVALNGAEPVDMATLRIFEDRFSKAGYADNVSFPVYGMAENCLAVTFPDLGSRVEVEELDAADGPIRSVSVGRPIAGQEVGIRGGDGHWAREGQIGEVLVRGASLMAGYHENPQATAQAIRAGWLHTGDLGFVRGGRLFITGRAKEMIIKRGRNYYPYDIERAAAQVRGVRKGCLVAFSVPAAESGTEDLVVVAEVKAADGSDRERIAKAITAEVLSAAGIRPDQVVLLPPRTIPKTTSGKLQRLLTRKRFMEGRLKKKLTERWLTPVKTVVGSFIGHQRFRRRKK